MLLTSQLQSQATSNPSAQNSAPVPDRYKGWILTTKVINGKLWLHWQHPQENLPRYGCPVSEAGLTATIIHVRFMIDLIMKLESEVQKHNMLQQW